MGYLMGLGIAAAGLFLLAVIHRMAPERTAFLSGLFEADHRDRRTRAVSYWRRQAIIFTAFVVFFAAYGSWIAAPMAALLGLSVVMMLRQKRGDYRTH